MDDPPPPDAVPHPLGFAGVAGQRLLAQEMFPECRRGQGRRRMGVVGSAVDEELNLGILHQTPPVGGAVLEAVAPGGLLRSGRGAARDPHQAQAHGGIREDVREFPQGIEVGPGHAGVTQHSHAHGQRGACRH